MKIPYWDSEITIYHREDKDDGSVTWKRSAHTGCFWQAKAQRMRMDGTEFKTASIICRILDLSSGVKIGDIIVHGNVRDEIEEYTAGKRSTDLLQKYAGKSMLVADVHENVRRGPIPAHIYAGG